MLLGGAEMTSTECRVCKSIVLNNYNMRNVLNVKYVDFISKLDAYLRNMTICNLQFIVENNCHDALLLQIIVVLQ